MLALLFVIGFSLYDYLYAKQRYQAFELAYALLILFQLQLVYLKGNSSIWVFIPITLFAVTIKALALIRQIPSQRQRYINTVLRNISISTLLVYLVLYLQAELPVLQDFSLYLCLCSLSAWVICLLLDKLSLKNKQLKT